MTEDNKNLIYLGFGALLGFDIAGAARPQDKIKQMEAEKLRITRQAQQGQNGETRFEPVHRTGMPDTTEQRFFTNKELLAECDRKIAHYETLPDLNATVVAGGMLCAASAICIAGIAVKKATGIRIPYIS